MKKFVFLICKRYHKIGIKIEDDKNHFADGGLKIFSMIASKIN